MRSIEKGAVVKVLTGEHAGRKAEVVRGASLEGTGRARLRLLQRKTKKGGEQLELRFTQSVRSIRRVK